MDTTNSVTLPPKYLLPIYMEDTSSDFQSSSSTTDCITSQEQNTPINLVKRGSGIYFE